LLLERHGNIMYNEINQQMEEAQQGIFRLKKIVSMLEELHKEQGLLEKKVTELKDILDKEDIDVEKLENKSLAHVFYSILGSMDDHVEKERREALSARLKYDQALRDLENVQYEITKLDLECADYNTCEYDYNRLYAEKKETLMKEGETARKLMDFKEQLNRSNNNRKEISEALAAGRNVIDSLENAQNSLNSAEGWGVWDMLGGGLISDLAKHSHIDDAKSEAEHSQTLLRRFKTELADVKINTEIQIETDGFAKFADFFFDGLIADWFMQSKIHNSQESVSQVKNQVFGVIHKLNQLENTEILNIETIEIEMNEMIIKG